MLDAQLNAFAALGSRFWPFKTIDRIASFFQAAARYPVGTPDRDARVAGMLDCPADAMVVGTQLDRLEQSPAAAALVDALPVSDGTSLVCSRTDCVLCGERLAFMIWLIGANRPSCAAGNAFFVEGAPNPLLHTRVSSTAMHTSLPLLLHTVRSPPSESCAMR